MMNYTLILDFRIRILDLRYSICFINGYREAIPLIQNPKSKIQNLQ